MLFNSKMENVYQPSKSWLQTIFNMRICKSQVIREKFPCNLYPTIILCCKKTSVIACITSCVLSYCNAVLHEVLRHCECSFARCNNITAIYNTAAKAWTCSTTLLRDRLQGNSLALSIVVLKLTLNFQNFYGIQVET